MASNNGESKRAHGAARLGAVLAFVSLLLLLAGCGGSPVVNPGSATVSSTTSPATAQPGEDVSVTMSGMPDGTINASGVTITMDPAPTQTAEQGQAAEAAQAPQSVTTTAKSVSGTGSTRTITFTIPASLVIDATTKYTVTVSGSTTDGRTFSSSNKANLTLNPSARIVSVTPGSGRAGSFVDVTIVGANTTFVAGQTQASFGPGTSIGNNSYDGQFGNVTVTNATTAVARVIIGSNATLGTRAVIVRTGSVSATLPNGFAVMAPNRNPVINIGGPYAGVAGQAITFNASATTDPDGDTLAYSWSFGDNTTGTGATVQKTFAAAGTYTVSLTVTDGFGGTATANVQVVVAPSNMPPVVNIGGPYSGTVNQTITFTATATDPENEALTFAWNFGDNTAGSGASVQKSFAAVGTYTVTLTVTDASGASASATASVSVTAIPNAAPVVNIGGPYSGLTNQSITFTGSATDADGDTLTYSWSFGDNTTASGASVQKAYATAGAYTVTLTVTDGRGGSTSATADVTITAAPNVAPVAVAGGPYAGNVGQLIAFSANGSSDADGDALTYAWEFGDNSTGSGQNISHSYSAAGSYTARVTVDDGRGGTNSATATVTITAPPQVSILTPAQSAVFNSNTITVTGSVSPANAAVSVNGIPAVVSGGSFTAENVPLREGVNLITAAAVDTAAGTAGTATVNVNLDVTPPVIRIDTPGETSLLTSPQVTVTGMVNDVVTGTVNDEQVTVTINGVPATVANRSFSVPDVLLAPGLNMLRAVARDKAGNESSITVQVTLADAGTQQRILAISGNNQTGVISSTLQQPLVVQLLDADDVPVPNRAVTFTVRRSDGVVKALPEEGQEITVLSDTNGMASVLFQLGTRTGVGVNEVVATSPGFAGEAVFSANSTSSPATSITAVHGENQRGIIGQQLALPLEVIVTDVGGNPVQAVPVDFVVAAGGGTLDNGVQSVSVATNSDGRARVMLTLGQQEGNNNNVVTANFSGNAGNGVTFVSTGLSLGSVAATSVSGVVLDNAQLPIPNATVKLAGTELTTVTDESGQFRINGAPVGTVTLTVDGSTSTRPEIFPFLSFLMQSLPGQDNTLNMPIYLPPIDTENSKVVGGPEDQVLTMNGVPGVAFTVRANSVTFPATTPNGVASTTGQLTLSQVHSDKVPMAPPNGASPRVVWTLQPAGAKFDPPIQVQLPNTDGLAPGQVVELFQFDHDLEQFVSVGIARVSADGSVIVSDPGFGITKAGWGAAAPPPPPTNCTISCDDGNECTSDSVQNPPCSCSNEPLSGSACGGETVGPNSCQGPGACSNGVCLGDVAPLNSTCDDGKFCTEGDKCVGLTCSGEPIPDGNPIVGTLEFQIPEFISGIKDAATRFGILEDFDVTISAEAKRSPKCCEARQIRQLDELERKVSLNAKLETDKIPVPGLSVPLGPAAKIGVFVKAGISVGMAVTNTKDQCAQPATSCWGGSVTAGGSIEGGVVLEDSTGLVSVSGSAQTGVQLEAAVNCTAVGYKVTIGEFKLKATVEFFDGAISEGFEYVVHPGFTGPQGTYTFPE